MGEKIVLEFRNISKAFPGVQALDHVSISVKEGDIHAIVGENGAGKSTLMKIAAGIYNLDDGEIFLKGQSLKNDNPREALMCGIGMVPQELNLIPEMTVAENVLLGVEPRHLFGIIDQKELHQRANDILVSLGLNIDLRQKLGSLKMAEQQMVQIARAIAFKCGVLILDEPTAPLSRREIDKLFEILRKLSQQGTTILYISHRMEEIFAIANKISVLRDGILTGNLIRSETSKEQVVQLMIGRNLQEYFRRKNETNLGEVVLEVRNLAYRNEFKDVSFKLHKGEILGFAGLVGAGRTEAIGSIFGNPPPDKGEILFKGDPVTIKNPRDAIRLGLGYIPEERKSQALFLILSVARNISMPIIKQLQQLFILNQDKEKIIVKEYADSLKIKTPSLSQEVRFLSGGNQQKVIIARWLASGAEVLIMDEPTRGIDVSAKAEIHTLIKDMASQGSSILLISSEVDELLLITDRIIIMREGSIVGDIESAITTEEEILQMAMTGKTVANSEQM